MQHRNQESRNTLHALHAGCGPGNFLFLFVFPPILLAYAFKYLFKDCFLIDQSLKNERVNSKQ